MTLASDEVVAGSVTKEAAIHGAIASTRRVYFMATVANRVNETQTRKYIRGEYSM
jgi:hypothetical protein